LPGYRGGVRTPDTDLVRVAACQVSLRVGEDARNRATALEAIFSAAAAGASVIILPELTPSGYVFESPAEARAAAEPAGGPAVAEWAAAAASRGVVIVGGFAELGEDGLLYNSAALVDPGGLRAVYRKAHLWDAESDFFTPGTAPPPVVDTAFGRIGMMICYDVEFPEWVRRPALAGADLLAVPTNWPAEPVPPGERPNVVLNVQGAAFANRMFVAAACRVGAERGVSWVGGSLVAGPDGYPLAGPAGAAGPELVIAGCDLARARDKATGPRNDTLADRRPALYG
jgi:predicted amidohydrolase